MSIDWTKASDLDIEAELARRAGWKEVREYYQVYTGYSPLDREVSQPIPTYLDPISGLGLQLRDLVPVLERLFPDEADTWEEAINFEHYFHKTRRQWEWFVEIIHAFGVSDSNLSRAFCLSFLKATEE
jgi:hypothetical protein